MRALLVVVILSLSSITARASECFVFLADLHPEKAVLAYEKLLASPVLSSMTPEQWLVWAESKKPFELPDSIPPSPEMVQVRYALNVIEKAAGESNLANFDKTLEKRAEEKNTVAKKKEIGRRKAQISYVPDIRAKHAKLPYIHAKQTINARVDNTAKTMSLYDTSDLSKPPKRITLPDDICKQYMYSVGADDGSVILVTARNKSSQDFLVYRRQPSGDYTMTRHSYAELIQGHPNPSTEKREIFLDISIDGKYASISRQSQDPVIVEITADAVKPIGGAYTYPVTHFATEQKSLAYALNIQKPANEYRMFMIPFAELPRFNSMRLEDYAQNPTKEVVRFPLKEVESHHTYDNQGELFRLKDAQGKPNRIVFYEYDGTVTDLSFISPYVDNLYYAGVIIDTVHRRITVRSDRQSVIWLFDFSGKRLGGYVSPAPKAEVMRFLNNDASELLVYVGEADKTYTYYSLGLQTDLIEAEVE